MPATPRPFASSQTGWRACHAGAPAGRADAGGNYALDAKQRLLQCQRTGGAVHPAHHQLGVPQAGGSAGVFVRPAENGPLVRVVENGKASYGFRCGQWNSSHGWAGQKHGILHGPRLPTAPKPHIDIAQHSGDGLCALPINSELRSAYSGNTRLRRTTPGTVRAAGFSAPYPWCCAAVRSRRSIAWES